MAPTRKVTLTIDPSVRTRLESLAISSGVTPDAYAANVVANHVIGVSVSHARPGGRPITVVPDDLPSDIERASNTTGFAGVAKVGRLFTARVGRQLIGKFSSAEMAAAVRYYALRGFRLGRGSLFAASGLPIEEAAELAARAGFAFEAAPPEVGPSAPSCTVCKDTGKMTLPPYIERSAKSSISYGRWWPCECPAGANVKKPTEWDVTGKPKSRSVIGNQPEGYVMDRERG